MTLTRLTGRLPFLPNDDDPFGLRILQILEPLHESSNFSSEPPEPLHRSPKPLSEVRSLIQRNSLPTNFVTGHLVGELLKALELPRIFLDEGTSSVIKDWAFKNHKQWRNNEPFKNGVSEGFVKHRRTQIQNLDLLDSSKFMTSLRETASEETSNANVEETCFSSNTESEYSNSVQEPQQFSTIAFMQELKNAVENTSAVRIHPSKRQVSADVIMDLEDLLEIRVTEPPFFGLKKILVDYSDSEDSMHEGR